MLALGGWSRPDDAEAKTLVAALGPEHAKQCPACGTVIMKYDGDDTMMCGCEAGPAGGTMEKALLGGGCGHEFNFGTGAPIGAGRPGEPANERQWKFIEPAAVQAQVADVAEPPLAAPAEALPAQAAPPPLAVLLTAPQHTAHLRKHSFACVARAHGAGGLPSAQTQALKFHLLAHQRRVTQFMTQESFLARGKQEARQCAARQSPIWIEGAEADSCMLCPPESRLQFWAVGPDTWRRHHCRSCGWAVCERCCPSKQRHELDRWVSSTAGHPVKHGLKWKRVCNACARSAPAEVRARQFEAALAVATATAAVATASGGRDGASDGPMDDAAQADVLRQLFPTLSLRHLARELPALAAFDDLLAQYRDTGGAMLDLTDPQFGGLTAAGLAELGVICPLLRRVYFHPSHAAITLHTYVAEIDLPTGVEPGEPFEYRVEGVAEPLSTVFPTAGEANGTLSAPLLTSLFRLV